jgi:hypothetical protein
MLARVAERKLQMQRLISIDVEVRGGREQIWAGNLRIRGNGNSGNYNQSKRDAGDPCPGADERSAQRTNDLRVTISRSYSDEGQDRFSVGATWTRPQDACPDGAGSRSVSFQQSVVLKSGETRELTGDGGLLVRLTRRQ